jgi:hypothetical protein
MNGILWLDYILLFPLELRQTVDATFELTPVGRLNTNRLLATDENETLFIVDFSGSSTYRIQRLNFTIAGLQELMDGLMTIETEELENGESGECEEYDCDYEEDDTERVLLERIIATHNDNSFWVLGSDNNIFLYTVGNRRLTHIGVEDRMIVRTFFHYREMFFVAQNPENERYELYLFQVGDTSPTRWRTFDELPEIAFASYDGVNYLALGLEEQTRIYASSRGRVLENAELYKAIEETGGVSFSPSGRFMQIGNKIYDIENSISFDDITSRHWFNGHIMSQMNEEGFFVHDFDGQNLRELAITPSRLDMVFLSDNNRRLHYFDEENNLIVIDLWETE